MKILVLSKKIPFPIIDGECMVIANELKAWKSLGAEIDLLSLNTQKHFVDPLLLNEEAKVLANIYAVNIDTAVKIIPAAINLFSSASYNINRFWSEQYANELRVLLSKQQYDCIILHGLYLAQYIPVIKEQYKGKIIMRSHNVEYKIWKRMAEECTSFLKKMYLELLARRIKKYELSQLNNCDHFVAISSNDLQQMVMDGLQKPNTFIPASVEMQPPIAIEKDRKSIFFIGSFDWQPNVNGVYWFIEKVWKELAIKFPDWKLTIAGRNFKPGMELNIASNVHWLGEVESATQLILSNNIMIVPLFSGSGMRVKIVEAMSLGKPIVSTTIGAEGIEYSNGEDILIADDAQAFQEALTTLIKNENIAHQMGMRAKEKAIAHYSIEGIAVQWLKILS